MTRIRKYIPAFLSILVMLIFSAIAFASEEGAAAEHGTSFLHDWLPRIINFGVLAAVLVYFGRKPIRDFLKARTEAIEKSLQESRETKEKAFAALAEMEQKVKDVQNETRRILDDARVRGEQDKQSLVEEGKKVVQDVQVQVKSAVDIEVQKARTSLAVEAALLSIDLAEEGIKDKMTSEDRDRIMKEYVKRVGGAR